MAGHVQLLGRDGTATDGRKFGSGTECVINPGGKAHAPITPPESEEVRPVGRPRSSRGMLP